MDENPPQSIDTDHGKVFICPDYFDISVVSDTRNIFQGLLDEKPEAIILNTESMEMIDTAAMQLLVAFVNDAKKYAINISYQLGNDVMCRTASTLGLIDHLGLECNN
jgi:anti-anti-sigma regulatory factor